MELKHNPVDVHFNVAVMTMANLYCRFGWNPWDGDYQNVQQLKDSILKNRTILVPDVFLNDIDVFDDQEHNMAFYAWFLKTYADVGISDNIDEQSARRTFNKMMLDVFTQYGYSTASRRYVDILDAMINQQYTYFKKYGDFPLNTREFVREVTNNGIEQALTKEW